MRMHIELDDDLVSAVDRLAGPRGRSDFVREALRVAVEQHERWAALRQAAASVPDGGHEWDDDPAAWVRQQRRGNPRRTG